MLNSPVNPESQALARSYQDPAYLGQHDLIQRYLRQELSATELACLETAIIANPVLIEHIEQQRLLNAAHRAEAAALQARVVTLGARPWARALPLAACLVIALFVVIRSPLWDGRMVDSDSDQAAQPVLILQTLRGSAAVYTVTAGAPLPLRIDVGPPRAGARYRLRLLDANSGQVRLQLDDLAADAEGWLQTNLTTTNLSGRHRLEVQSQDASQTQRFLLDLQ